MDIEQIPVSDEVLAVMRNAATGALSANEPFITPRRMLIALLHEPSLAESLAAAVDVNALEGLACDPHDLPGVSELPEDKMPDGERPAMLRYDTLAFKDLDGKQTVWLNAQAHAVFLEGARHAEGRYVPKHLALAFVSEARRQPHVLGDLKIDGGKLSEIVFKL